LGTIIMNREGAQQCLNRAKESVRESKWEKALKWAEKSMRMHATEEARALLERIHRLKNAAPDTTSTARHTKKYAEKMIDVGNRLLDAIAAEDAPTVRTMMAKGVSPDFRENAASRSRVGRAGKMEVGGNALSLAVKVGNITIVKHLVEAGAKLDTITNSRGGMRSTVLYLACGAVRAQQLEIVRELLQHGANVNIRAIHQHFNGGTALLVAASSGSLDLVRLLADHGAALDAQDDRGSTAIRNAVDAAAACAADAQLLPPDAPQKFAEVVDALLHRGAAVDIASSTGFCPVQRVMQEMFDSRGADVSKTMMPLLQILLRHGTYQ